MEKGKLIVVEGACDGIGKSTQSAYLKEALKQDGRIITSHHFPTYDTAQGMLVQKYLNGEFGTTNSLSPYVIHNFYAIDRAVTWHTILKERYESGEVILLDRYTTSSLIYQTALVNFSERRSFIDYICDFEYNKMGIKEPDNVIFLTAPFDLVTEMRKKRTGNDGVANDIHERDLKYMHQVYENAQYVAEYLNWDIIECSRDNEMLSQEKIHEEVLKRVLQK